MQRGQTYLDLPQNGTVLAEGRNLLPPCDGREFLSQARLATTNVVELEAFQELVGGGFDAVVPVPEFVLVQLLDGVPLRRCQLVVCYTCSCFRA